MRIIQFLNWDIKSIIENLDNVKELNFDTIQINPVQPFINVEGNEWWATYQPLDFTIGNIYGNKNDLKKLCKKAEQKGIKIVVDVITNHLANDGLGKATTPNKDINKKLKNRIDFWKNHKKVYDFASYEDIINESIGLPGLDLENIDLQDIILNFLEELKKCGVSGFRFDAAKHIGLPSDGVTYFERVKEFLDENNLFGYAEFLDGPNNISKKLTQTLLDKKNEFTDLMYILTEEDSLVDDSSKKITFVESHDTYLNDYGSTKNEKTEKIIDEYETLTKKYPNTLFYVRDLSRGDKKFITHDRAAYADTSWIDNEKIKRANLNYGDEIKNADIIAKEEKSVMRKNLNLYHQISSKIHEIFINMINEASSIDECTNLAISEYNLQFILNSYLGVLPYDDDLVQYIIGEIYNKKWNEPPLIHTPYPTFYKKVLEGLKNRAINYDVIDGHKAKIKELSKN